MTLSNTYGNGRDHEPKTPQGSSGRKPSRARVSPPPQTPEQREALMRATWGNRKGQQ